MARRLPPLNALKALEAAARLSSFTRAATELNVTHAAISRHVRALETEFRTPLFERTGRGVELTEAGQALALELTKGFDLIAAAASRFARPSRRKRRLRVTSDPSFAALWLVPRLGTFTARHPGIELFVDASPRLVDFAKEDVDVGIRWGGGVWAGVEAKKLADAELTLVCSPKFLRENPMSAPHEIDGELLIHETAKECWNAWLLAAGIADRVAPAGPTLNGDLAIAAAEAGQGLTLADQIQVGDALAAGRLVRPFDVVAKRFGYFFVRPVGAKPSDAATAFEAWLEAELKLFASGFADSTKAKRRPTRTSIKASPASVRSASGTRR